MKSDKLLDAMEYIADDKIQDARLENEKKRNKWFRMTVVAACLCGAFIGIVAGVSFFKKATGDSNDAPSDSLPEEITPHVYVNGKLFYWAGLSTIPKEYMEYGEIAENTENIPDKELQLQAGFEASGMIYVCEESPEVVYISLTTERLKNEGIRFVSYELMDGELIAYQNQLYQMKYNKDDMDLLDVLPEECVLLGMLHYSGRDTVPEKDLNTNVINDSYSMDSMEGREVYGNPGDETVLYVKVFKYSREGKTELFQRCYLLKE